MFLDIEMELLFRNLLALLVPASVLTFTFFWWKRKSNSYQFIDPKQEVENDSEINVEVSDVPSNEEADKILYSIQDIFVSDEVLTINDTCRKTSNRKRQQSLCDCDSAYVEDYSSDGGSGISGTESINCKPPDKICHDCGESPTSELILLKELDSEKCKCRDWYNNAIEPSAEYKVLHWGSLPVSDIEGDDNVLKSDCVAGVALEKLSIVLDNQYKEQRKKIKYQKSRKNKEKIPVLKSQSPSKKSAKKMEGAKKHASKKKLNEEKNIDRPWREQSEVLLKSDQYLVREFEVSENLCGKIIGRHGRSVKEIYDNTGATVCIECEKRGMKCVVSIAGLFSQVQKAERLLLSRFKNSMKKIDDELFPLMEMYLESESLKCESSVNVIVTAIVNAGNLFVQIFDEKVDSNLVTLQNDLANKYMKVPQKLMYVMEMKPRVNDLCIGFIDNTWCRLKILEYLDAEHVSVSFLDYGGVATVHWQMVFRIR